jgi:hypothetical protein
MGESEADDHRNGPRAAALCADPAGAPCAQSVARRDVQSRSEAKGQQPVEPQREPGLPLKKGRASTMTHDYKRLVFHFTPTSCSWLNAVETFFSSGPQTPTISSPPLTAGAKR